MKTLGFENNNGVCVPHDLTKEWINCISICGSLLKTQQKWSQQCETKKFQEKIKSQSATEEGDAVYREINTHMTWWTQENRE